MSSEKLNSNFHADLQVSETPEMLPLTSECGRQEMEIQVFDAVASSSEVQGAKRDMVSDVAILLSGGETQKTRRDEASNAMVSSFESAVQKIDAASKAPVSLFESEALNIKRDEASHAVTFPSEGEVLEAERDGTSYRLILSSGSEAQENKRDVSSNGLILSREGETQEPEMKKALETPEQLAKSKTQEAQGDAADLSLEPEADGTTRGMNLNTDSIANTSWKVENPYQTVNNPPRPLTIYCEIDEPEPSIECVKESNDDEQQDVHQSASPQNFCAENTFKNELGETVCNTSAEKSSNDSITAVSNDAFFENVNTNDLMQHKDNLGKDNTDTETVSVRKSKVVKFKDIELNKLESQRLLKEKFESNPTIEITVRRDSNSCRDKDQGCLEEKKTEICATKSEKTEGRTPSHMINSSKISSSSDSSSLENLSHNERRSELIPGSSSKLEKALHGASGADSVHKSDRKMSDEKEAILNNDANLNGGNRSLPDGLSEVISNKEQIQSINTSDEELKLCTSEGKECMKNTSNSADTEVQNKSTETITEISDEISSEDVEKNKDEHVPRVISQVNEAVVKTSGNNENKEQIEANTGSGEMEKLEDTSMTSKSCISPSKTKVDEHGRPIRKSLSSVARTSSLKQKAYDKFTNVNDDGTRSKTEVSDKSSESKKVSRAESFSSKALKIIQRRKSDVKLGEGTDEVDMKDKAHGLLYMRKKRLFSPWRRYFFVLDGSQLSYYRSRQHYSSLTGCQGAIDLTLLHDVVQKKPSTLFRTYYPLLLERRSLSPIMLGADCEAEQLRWLELLQRALGARKAASRKFSEKASSSKASSDVVASTLPSSSKKKRKNSFGRSLSFRRRSKEKIKDGCDLDESDEDEENSMNDQKSDFKKLDNKIEETNSEDEEKGLVKPKKILKNGILLPAGDINSVRLKKVNVEGNDTKDPMSTKEAENEELCPEQMFGVQLKKTSFKKKYLSENAEMVKEETEEGKEGGHDFRSLLRSRRTSTTGVDTKLYVKYGNAETSENNEKSTRKRSPSPSLPLSKSLQGVINRSTDSDHLVLEGKTESNVQRKNGGDVRPAKSTDIVDLMNGKTCSVNHANADRIRYSDPPRELKTTNEGFKAHPKLELKFSEERRESSLLETIELLDDTSVVRDCNNGGENPSLELADGMKVAEKTDICSNSDARKEKVSSLTNIILSPVSKECPHISYCHTQKTDNSENDESMSDFRFGKSFADADENRDDHNHSAISSIPISGAECEAENMMKSELTESVQSKGTFELHALSESEITDMSEAKRSHNSASEDEDLNNDEHVFVHLPRSNEAVEKPEARMNDHSKENDPSHLYRGSPEKDEEREEYAVVRHNNSTFSFRSPSRNSEPISFDDPSLNTIVDSRRTSAAEYGTIDRPDYTPQISVARSSSAESGEPLVRTSFMGNRFSWDSGSNFCGTRNSSSDTNTSKESVGSSSTNPSRRHSYGNDLTVPDAPHATRAKTPAGVSDPSPASGSGAVMRKLPSRKRQERPTSGSNRESLILPEFVVLEEDVSDSTPSAASGILKQSDVLDEK